MTNPSNYLVSNLTSNINYLHLLFTCELLLSNVIFTNLTLDKLTNYIPFNIDGKISFQNDVKATFKIDVKTKFQVDVITTFKIDVPNTIIKIYNPMCRQLFSRHLVQWISFRQKDFDLSNDERNTFGGGSVQLFNQRLH